MQLKDAINQFEFHCQFELNLSEKTIMAYAIDLNQFKQFDCYADLNVCSLEKNKLKLYIRFLYSLGLKPKTIKRKVAVLKVFFNHLEFDEVIAINPFRKMKINIKEPKILPKIIDFKEVKQFLKFLYAKKELINKSNEYQYKTLIRDILIIEILFSTGIRISELCNIQHQHINIQTGNICIQGKGGKERIIQVCDKEVKSILKEYNNLFQQQLANSSYFLVNRINQRLSEQSIRLMIKKYQQLSGISKHITPHMFRHSFATLLLEEGVDIRYIQHMLGHASISTTQIYTQVNAKQQQKILKSKHPRRLLSFV